MTEVLEQPRKVISNDPQRNASMDSVLIKVEDVIRDNRPELFSALVERYDYKSANPSLRPYQLDLFTRTGDPNAMVIDSISENPDGEIELTHKRAGDFLVGGESDPFLTYEQAVAIKRDRYNLRQEETLEVLQAFKVCGGSETTWKTLIENGRANYIESLPEDIHSLDNMMGIDGMLCYDGEDNSAPNRLLYKLGDPRFPAVIAEVTFDRLDNYKGDQSLAINVVNGTAIPKITFHY